MRHLIFNVAAVVALCACAAPRVDSTSPAPPSGQLQDKTEFILELTHRLSEELRERIPYDSSLEEVVAHLGRAPVDCSIAIMLGSDRPGRSRHRWQALYMWFLPPEGDISLAVVCGFDNQGGPFGANFVMDSLDVRVLEVAVAFSSSFAAGARSAGGVEEFERRERAAQLILDNLQAAGSER